MDYSRICAEGDLQRLERIAEAVASRARVRVVKQPVTAMVMIGSADSLEGTPFRLGEVLVTECEVEVDGNLGYGCVIGDQPERSLFGAVVDAVLGSDHETRRDVEAMLEEEGGRLEDRRNLEERAAATTKVDFDVR
jgi:alpha-D-ribose 1-methylphosphonate 5-triphosphate synthase subunit PhnG